MIKNIFIGAVLILLMIASAGATVVKVDPASQTIAAGDTFHVNVRVEGVVNLVADQAVLNFDHNAMQVTDVIEGDFLTNVGGTLGFPIVDNTTGTAMFAYSFNSLTDKVSGTGTLATIQFSTYPDAPADTYNLNLTAVMLLDVNDVDILTDVSNGTVTIEGAPVPPPPTPVPVPVLSGIGMIALIAALAVVLAISVSSATRRRKK